MLYTFLTNKALKLAYAAHQGQTDQSGIPYIFHPYHLAELMPDEITICTALLHDVVEDTDITIEDLEKDFPKEVTEALSLLTRKKGTDYLEYIYSIRENHVARVVKLADVIHNLDETRIACCKDISDEKLKYRREKYKKARMILEEEI